MGIRARRFAGAVVLVGALLGACGDDDDEDTTGTTAADASEEVLIETMVHFDFGEEGAPPVVTGEVLDGSQIGTAPFCTGGTFRDTEGTDEIGFVDRTFECDDGTLRIGFSPSEPQGNVQRGPWKVVSGTGAYEGLQASGQMVAEFEDQPGDTAATPVDHTGHETFTGTVVAGD